MISRSNRRRRRKKAKIHERIAVHGYLYTLQQQQQAVSINKTQCHTSAYRRTKHTQNPWYMQSYRNP